MADPKPGEAQAQGQEAPVKAEGQAQVQPQVQPPPEPQPVPPEGEAPPKQEGEVQAEPEAKALVEQPKAVQPDWRESRLRVETAKRREAEAKARALAEQLEAVKTGAAGGLPPAEVERRARELAAYQSQWNAFNDACTATLNKGRESFGDFDSRVGELMKLRDPQDEQSQATYNTFLAAAIETGEGPRILHELGGNLNEAARIMALAPVKMAVELTKLATQPVREYSKAPKPISPVGRGASGVTSIDPADPERADNLSTKEWMKRREAQIAERERPRR